MRFLQKFVKIFCLLYRGAPDSLMENTTDNNLNDNRVREKEYEYLLRAYAKAVWENTVSKRKKSEKWKEATREKESVLLTVLSRTAVHEYYIRGTQPAVILAARAYSFRHLAQTK